VKRIDNRKDLKRYPKLAEIVRTIKAICRHYEMPMPEIGIYPSREINAFATGRPGDSLIAISTGLIKNFTDEEIKGVLAHEVSHLIHKDLRFILLVQGICDLVTIILSSLVFALAMSRRSDEEESFVIVPSYRLDIENQEDLVEEIARIYGYNNLPSSLPVFQQNKIIIDKNQTYRELIRQQLSNLGYQEIITYSLVSQAIKNDFCLSIENEFYQLLVPKSENHVYYRQNILPSHLKTIAYNLTHQNENVFFFEISKIYSPNEEEILTLSGTGKIIANPIHKLEQDHDFF
ncbi:681_t:CDS:2, partial [Entrophospora sp. SA101]